MRHTIQIEPLLHIISQWEYVVLYLSSTALLGSVALRLMDKATQAETPLKREKDSIATATMTLFFLALYAMGRLQFGRLALSTEAETAAKLLGSMIVVGATAINIAARIVIGRYWSDQVEILDGHRIVRAWPYSWCRHPMYGSLVLFGVGMGLLAVNPVVVVGILVVFLPAMIRRASHEERLLLSACPIDYGAFQLETSMVMPRFPEPISRVLRECLAALQIWSILSESLDLFVLASVVTLGLSFIMARRDFRAAYKIKAIFMLGLSGLVFFNTKCLPVLWIPTAAALMSISGRCPGTILINRLFPTLGERPHLRPGEKP
jgi:protein-S-isoprenylcysteine O-methyltransferase Ste14